MILLLRAALFVVLIALVVLTTIFTPGLPDEFLAIAAAEKVASSDS